MVRDRRGELIWLSALAALGAGFALSREDYIFAVTFIAMALLAVAVLAAEAVE